MTRTSPTLPRSTSRWNEVKNFKDLSHFETFYVVKIHNAWQVRIAARGAAQPLVVSKRCARAVRVHN